MNRWRKTFVGELFEVALVALLIFLGVRIAFQNFVVHGISMMPGLHNNELVLVDKLSYDFIAPQRGDIIVFRYPFSPPSAPEDFIKRIIAVPGDRVIIHNGGVYVNGRRLRENYIEHPYPRGYSLPPDIPFSGTSVVPPDDYYVLGDNRIPSDDSHIWGLVPRSDIIGRAILAYWPIQDLHILTDPSTRTSAEKASR